MKFNPDRHHRRSIRLSGYDYTQPGAYFVTICTRQRECTLGVVQDQTVILSPSGQIAKQCWNALASHFLFLNLDAFVIMPNHLHGIIVITHSEQSKSETAIPVRPSSPKGTQSDSLSAILQNFKSVSTRKINQVHQNRGATVWQRGYYERVIRDDTELSRIRQYIETNPNRWINTI
jgi:REP-associated tyrosine transposase